MEVKTMHTQGSIRRHLLNMPEQVIFTTREFLIYGTRSAVDQALYRMVNDGYLCRLARGVFVRPQHNHNISPWDVAKAKAEAYGKRLAFWAGHLVEELGLRPAHSSRTIYATDGCSSSFRFGKHIIELRKTSPRKMRYSDERSGKGIKALLHLGAKEVTAQDTLHLYQQCLRTEKEELRLSFGWMPDWLNRHFMWIRLPKYVYYQYPHAYAELPI
jgi:hypothetical protein